MAYPQVTFRQTSVDGPSIVSRRRTAVFENTLLYQLNVLKSTGRYDAFRLQWHPSYSDDPDVWPVPNHLFWDSDIAKWIESACYFLEWKSHVEVANAVHELVEMIRGAQQADGYLNIHFTVVKPGQRFTNIRDLHELYNAGHLIEAALAHHQHFGNDRLLEPMMKYADLLCRCFGPKHGQIHGYPGHPEIELALLRLYNRVREERYLDLARYFIEERGNPKGDFGRHFYDVERDRRGEDPRARPAYHSESNALFYYQAHKPIPEQKTIEGHAVRAMYLLTATTDLLRFPQQDRLLWHQAVRRLWNNMVERKMYVTGGIGAIKSFEGFGPDFFLPPGTDEGGCYAETCAGIGVMMLAERLLQVELAGAYADIMELAFYNAVLTGMSCDGRKFTYDNQLASSDTNPSKRAEWFTCACCPPNISRLLGSIGGYLWSQTDGDDGTAQINVHMMTNATLSFNVDGAPGALRVETQWPWSGDARFQLTAPGKAVTVRVRIPQWAPSFKLQPEAAGSCLENGYLHLNAAYLTQNPTFTISIPLQPRFISPHPYTNQDTVSLALGPIIYCAEDVDNPWVDDHFRSTLVDPLACSISQTEVTDPETGEFYVRMRLEGGIAQLQLPSKHNTEPFSSVQTIDSIKAASGNHLELIPYYFRGNRGGKGHMRAAFTRWHPPNVKVDTVRLVI